MTPERLQLEYAALSAYFSPKQFQLDMNRLVFAIQTNSKKVYTIKVDLTGGFPYSVPSVFILTPKPLLTCQGMSMLEASHSMHTLEGEDGCVKVCHYGQIDWVPNVSLYQVIVKVRIWLEMYEVHLKTGRSLDYYLTSASQ